MKKLLIFCVATLPPMHGARALSLCERFTSPSACGSCTSDVWVNHLLVYNCSGGSSATEFEVWGGCSATSGSGGYDNPIPQEKPADLVYASNAGEFQGGCYCQIKSINGIAVPSSSLWVFYRISLLGLCRATCADSCAIIAQRYSGFRSALFSAVGN